MEKRCTKCGETKPLSEFYQQKTGKDGRQAHCKDCDKKRCHQYRQGHKTDSKKRNKKHRQAHKDFIIQFHTSCWICNATKKLVYHHVIPTTKLYSVTDMYNKPHNLIIQEIAKCISLCDSCHKRLHAKSHKK